MKRALSLLLALAMCAFVFFGCAKTDEGGETQSGTVNTGDETDELGNYNFGGTDFTILSRTSTSYEHIGEFGDDTVSSAVYQRNVAVEERFGVNIEVVEMDGDWDSTDLSARDAFIATLRAEHMAGNGSYDLVSTHCVYLGWMSSEGIFADLASLPQVDLTVPYWNQNLYDALNIDGRCYIMLGDIAHTLYEYLEVMFVNTDILSQQQIIEGGIDSVYDMVDKGTWTWDELYEMSQKYGTSNLQTDLTDSSENFALLFNTHANHAAMMSQDAYVYSKNAEGRYELENSASDRLLTTVDNLARFFGVGGSSVFYEDWGTAEDFLNPAFTSKRALFYAQTLGNSEKFSADMGAGYAVLPLPKFNTDQTEYYTICCNMVSAVAVMSCAKDYKMCGVITQALGKYGSENVTPEYYERALKYRYADDPRCPEILDKIRDSVTIDAVTTFYENALGANMFRNSVAKGDSSGVTSTYQSSLASARSLLNEFYTDIEIINS